MAACVWICTCKRQEWKLLRLGEESQLKPSRMHPCARRYQVCLFCYGQVKEKCSALCPGCRREYGDPVEPHEVIRQPVADISVQPAAGTAPRILLVGKSALSPGLGAPNGLQAGSVAARAGPGAAVRSVAITAIKTGPGGLLVPETGTLPTGATWATGPGAQRPPAGAPPLPPPLQAAAPSLADESAWPSLDSASTKPPQQGGHHHQHQGHQADSMRHVGSALSSIESASSLPRSASSGSACADSVTSRSSSSQDLAPAGRSHHLDTSAFPPLQQQQQQQQQPHPAANLGAGGSPEASARLVAMLRGQGKAPPPGFSAPAGVSSNASGLINTQDPSISVLPLGKYQPIQPPSASSNAATREQQQQQQLWSMWSGLPGIDLGSVCLSIWPSVPASHGGGRGDQRWAPQRFGGVTGMDLGNGGGGPAMAPPPGFGGSVGQHAAGYGAQAQFRAPPGIGMYGMAAY
jgi:hypothetical protein